jgi:hypothetical protein
VALAAILVEPSGGNLEPFLYVLLIWITRKHPLWCGLVFGIGFLQREFTVYALVALLTVEGLQRTLFTRQGLARRGAMMAVAAAVWAIVQGLRTYSSGSGPGTSIDHLYGASNNILELATRTCISPATAAAGIARLFTIHWPALLGTAPFPLSAFGIESSGRQGLALSSWLPAGLVIVLLAGIILVPLANRRVPVPPAFAGYLAAIGLCSIAGYVVGRCGQVNFAGMRYELLSIFGIVGLTAWFLSTPRPAVLTGAWAVLLAAWLLVAGVPHVQLAAEYAHQPPVPAKRQLINILESRGVRYGTADYWLAYYISFMTGERMIFAADDVQRVRTYNAIVAEHAGESIHLSRRRCGGGALVIPGVYQCP